MFKKIGIKIRTKKAAKNRSAVDKTINHKTVGIISTDSEEKSGSIKQFSKELSAKGYDVQMLIFHQKKLKQELESHFDKKSYDWKGKILSPTLKDFVKTPFDFLFSINTSSNLQIENVLALSNAKCRVGANIDDINKNLDLVVNMPNTSSTKELTANILEYTERIA